MTRSGLETRTARPPAWTSAAGGFAMGVTLAARTDEDGVMEGPADPRLRAALDASRAWYDDVFALHGIATTTGDGLWWALADPPPWHSAAKTLEPGVPVDRVLDAVADRPSCAVADSFGDLDLGRHGFRLLVEATWLHRPAQ